MSQMLHSGFSVHPSPRPINEKLPHYVRTMSMGDPPWRPTSTIGRVAEYWVNLTPSLLRCLRTGSISICRQICWRRSHWHLFIPVGTIGQLTAHKFAAWPVAASTNQQFVPSLGFNLSLTHSHQLWLFELLWELSLYEFQYDLTQVCRNFLGNHVIFADILIKSGKINW